MQVLCGQCGRTSDVDDAVAGTTIQCPHCDHEIHIPEPEYPTGPASAAAADVHKEGFAGEAMKMMARKLVITCGSCGKSLKASRKFIGKKVRCPACSTRIRVPFPGDDEPVLTVGARRGRAGMQLPPMREEDLEGLPMAKLVRPPLPGWVWLVGAALIGGLASVGILVYLAIGS